MTQCLTFELNYEPEEDGDDDKEQERRNEKPAEFMKNISHDLKENMENQVPEGKWKKQVQGARIWKREEVSLDPIEGETGAGLEGKKGLLCRGSK